MNLDYIFPTPIWWVDLDIDLAEMGRICVDTACNMEGQARSNRGMLNYQSPDFYGEPIINDPDLDGDEFKKLLILIKEKACEAFDSFGSTSTTIEYANVWMNINGKGGYNEVHTHPGAVMSGAFYVTVPPGPVGKLTFHRDAAEGYMIHSLGTSMDMSTAEVPHTHSTWAYPPVNGRLMLFPAWVPHGVRENETDEERISISFNFVPVRTKKDMMNIIKQNEQTPSNLSYHRQTGADNPD
jgi:uncharacterized protein (TIGR02466 family)